MIGEAEIYNSTKGTTLYFNQSDAEFLIDDGGLQVEDLESAISSYSIFDRIGEKINTVQIDSGRTITITGWVINIPESSLEDKKAKLSRIINPLDELKFTSRGRSINCRAKKAVEFGNKYKDNNDLICKFKIELYCPYPLFAGKPIRVQYTKIPASIVAPCNQFLEFDSAGSSLDSFVNPGDVTTGFEMDFTTSTASSGIEISNTYLTKDNIFKIKTSKNISGQYILNTELDTDSYGFYFYSSGSKVLDLEGLDLRSSFFGLRPGTNKIKITGSNTSGGIAAKFLSSVAITFTPKYFSLEGQ